MLPRTPSETRLSQTALFKPSLWLRLLVLWFALSLAACSSATKTPVVGPPPAQTATKGPAGAEDTPVPVTPAPTVTPTTPPRLLTICLGQEPASLFLYSAGSRAAASILQAVYDGPVDLNGYTYQPVILEAIPSLENGGLSIEAVQVKPGELIVGADGYWTNLQEGVLYRPAGCQASTCAMAYSGSEPVQMDSLVARYRLLPGLTWSDGQPLRADDSVFSYEIASSLFPAYRAELIGLTRAYQAVDETTVEWRGVPGFLGGPTPTYFFSPLPRHAWSGLAVDELEAKLPLGWGPYIFEDWVKGDHISLRKNPLYFRAGEGLPHFDQLVYRFVDTPEGARQALLAGECDLVDESAALETDLGSLQEAEAAGELKTSLAAGSAWELALFNLLPANEDHTSLFTMKEVRQAVALCIDRQAIVTALFGPASATSNTYVPPAHPLYNSDTPAYLYNREQAIQLLEAVGWVDPDNNPLTPRVSRGVPGLTDDTQFAFTYLVADDEQRLQAAEMVKTSLQDCGLQARVEAMPWDQLLAAGPEGPVFGRRFDLAQFGWTASLEPPCDLFRSTEIPGPYPEYPKGWGGANAAGYANPQFEAACAEAHQALYGSPDYSQAHQSAQAIFAADLPAIPLYLHLQAAAYRPDLCGLEKTSPLQNLLWNLEKLDILGECR